MPPAPKLPSRPKAIGIVGSRRRNTDSDFRKVLDVFIKMYNEGDWIISGGCPTGADHFAERIAKEYGVTITIHYPNFKKYDKSAGPIRNTKIARDCDILVALVTEDRTGGTEDTISKASKMGKKVLLL